VFYSVSLNMLAQGMASRRQTPIYISTGNAKEVIILRRAFCRGAHLWNSEEAASELRVANQICDEALARTLLQRAGK
jgi:hypothetical protein